MLDIVINILLFIVVLGILVFVHELGHYLAAKSVKATIYEFALGFGPKLLSKKYKGIIYSIRVIPLGGYVKIAGDGDPGSKEAKRELADKNSLKKKSKIAQAFVMSAGVIMNIIFAIVVYTFVLSQSDWYISLTSEFTDFNPVIGDIEYEKVGDVEYSGLLDDSGAKEADLPEEGIVKFIGGKEIEYTFDITDALDGKENKLVSIEVCVEEVCDAYDVKVSEEGYLGIMVYSNYIVNISYENNKTISGVAHLLNIAKLTYQKISSLFAEAKETGDYTEVANTFTGPVGIYLVLDYFKQFGFIGILSILADLSFSLALMNILPIPALDGGRILILMIEAIFKKDLSEKVEATIINISFIFLLVLIVAIFIKDFFTLDSIKSMFS